MNLGMVVAESLSVISLRKGSSALCKSLKKLNCQYDILVKKVAADAAPIRNDSRFWLGWNDSLVQGKIRKSTGAKGNWIGSKKTELSVAGSDAGT